MELVSHPSAMVKTAAGDTIKARCARVRFTFTVKVNVSVRVMVRVTYVRCRRWMYYSVCMRMCA